MTIEEAIVRVVPKEFRTPDYVFSRNNIYERGSGKLVGQLEEPVVSTKQYLPRLCGSNKRLEFLNSAGSVASILNLGVSVVGFMHVSKLLRRIEDRIEGIEAKLDELGELVGVIDQKVDQLIELSEVQVAALGRIHDLIVSFETAKVHAALETLDFISVEERTRQRDERLIDAAETLQAFRNWLADKRDSTDISARAVRTELLRAEVAIALAECRARCLAGDVSFAGRVLDKVISAARPEVEAMYEWVMAHDGLQHLVIPQWLAPFDFDDAVDAAAWIEGVDRTKAAVGLLTLTKGSLVSAVEGRVQIRANAALILMAATTGISGPRDEELDRLRDIRDLATELINPKNVGLILVEAGRGISGPRDKEIDRLRDIRDLATELTNQLEDDDATVAKPCDAAAVIAAFHLVRDLEAARGMCTAMEICGEPLRELLAETASPSSSGSDRVALSEPQTHRSCQTGSPMVA